MSTLIPSKPRFETQNIPTDIRGLPQWVAWKYAKRGGKQTKAPVNPTTGRLADSTDPTTWGTFQQALDICQRDDNLAGIGFVFSPDDPYCGVDLDNCVDPDTGEVADWAAEIIAELDSYTEISPSGTGVKIFLEASKPGTRCKTGYHSGAVEIYDRNRFFTLTGEQWPNVSVEIEPRQDALDRIYHAVMGEPDKDLPATTPKHAISDVRLEDEEIIALAKRQRRSGAKFTSLWDGNWDGHFNSASEADSSLVFMLAFYTKDPVQIDRIFRMSGLMREKWDERHGQQTYGEMTIANAIEKVTGQYRPKGRRRPPENGALPEIFVQDVQLDDLTAAAITALENANDPPQVFVRGGKLVRVILDENGQPTIETLSCVEMRCRLSEVANFFAMRRNEKVGVNPPKPLAENILARGRWDFPPLVGIARAPIVHADGTICTTPGYDPLSALMYCPDRGLKVPAIPENPTQQEVQDAVKVLQNLVADFPFVDEASRANALAILFSILLRPVISGQVPLAIVDAPMQGTGKSLLVTALAMIAVGNAAAESIPSKDNDDEWRKKITSILLNSSPFVLLDNIPDNTTIDSPPLAAALTAREWSDRRLGKNETIRVPSRSVWVATGNNLRVAGDMPRRCYSIRLDANVAKPWERSGFKIDDLEKYVADNRSELLAAALTVIRGWFSQGKPQARVPVFGSFVEWSTTVGSVLEFAGVPGFLGNLQQTQTVQDEDTQEWSAFFDLWWDEFGESPVTVSDLLKKVEWRGTDVLPGAVSELSERGDGALRRSLGRHLMRLKGRIFNGRKLGEAGLDAHRKVRRWKLAGLVTPQNVNNPATNPAEKGLS